MLNVPRQRSLSWEVDYNESRLELKRDKKTDSNLLSYSTYKVTKTTYRRLR